MEHSEIREQIVDYARRCYDRGMIVAGDGNISARIARDRILATPSGVSKGWMTPDMIVLVDLEGRPLENTKYRVSSEFPMHQIIYRHRPDIHAVVHAHPPHATGFAVAGLALDKAILSEVVLTLGCVPLARYGTPSTDELTAAIEPYLAYHDALLMANHGAVAYAETLEKAFNKLETLEHTARISLIARSLGNENTLPVDAIEKLYEIRERGGMMRPEARTNQACPYTPEQAASGVNIHESVTLTRDELLELLVESAQLARR
ncbi:MAG: class II aldolase/adducin family protein [Acidobacteria bacterium]|nr:class II aldolase/adducin family protein [Acidobacteriota bacterium]MCW5968180.1 class II aldolase/adducin family protein [Blastocatellales bacterium]